MRRLAGEVAKLWIVRRDELGHPLGLSSPPPPAVASAVAGGDLPRMLAFEIGTEEMPPAEAAAAREQVQRLLTERLAATRLGHGDVRVFATPRRLVAVVETVAAREPDRVRTVKGPRLAAAFDAAGAPTRALLGFARSQGVDVAEVERDDEAVYVERFEPGEPAPVVLAGVLGGVVTALRASRNMRWNDPHLAFTRPIRWLLALWGPDVVPVAVSTLAAGRTTRVLRTAETPEIEVATAESFMETIAVNGIVADPEDRRELIVTGAQDLVYGTGRVTVDSLVDEITYLVEAPTALLGSFDERYLELPGTVLTTVMRKHQRYLPVRDETGALMPLFVTVANGPVDVERVREGNEAMLRARFEDAVFFYRADRETPLAAMRDKLAGLTFTDELGSMADRAARIAALALRLAPQPSATLARAAALVKFDLGSQLVTEMTSLAGVMARDYALHAGEPRQVAQAVYEAELPRNTGDDLPASLPGALLSLADRLDLVAGLAATVGLPTGSSDPFAVRRAVLGLLAVHRAHPALAALSLADGLRAAAARLPVPVSDEVLAACAEFVAKRLEQTLAEEGFPIDRVRAVLRHADRPSVAGNLLTQLATVTANPDFVAVAEAVQRARRIVPPAAVSSYDTGVLKEPAEVALVAAVAAVRDELGEAPEPDLFRFTEVVSRLVAPLATFFDEVFVMA